MDPILGHVITGVVSLFVGLVLQRLTYRPKLKFFLPGTFFFDLKNPNVQIQTDSLTIQNFGKSSAENIEIIHKEKPDHFQFSQAIAYTEITNPNGEHIIKIPNLGPREFINVQYLSHSKAPILLRVRSDQGQAEMIQVQFQPIYPKWLQAIAIALMLCGFGTLFYFSIKAALWASAFLHAFST